MKNNIIILSIVAASFVLALSASAFVIYNQKPKDLRERANQLKIYCLEHGYNADYGILVDYSRSSVQRRLYVYDFNKNEVVMSALAGHGSGGKSTIFLADFSNTHGSYCSSLGHYRIGRHRHMYNRPAVPAIELAGLDNTNSNAMARGILIHPSAWPLSWGCVTLPLDRYHQLSEILSSLPKNVIMWVYV